MARERRPRLAVFKLASCDGCQLSLLDCEDELLEVAGTVEIAHFLEASRAAVKGPYDLTLVEGSITTPADAARIRELRQQSKKLVTIGACATTGGIQALRNFRDVGELAATVYAHPEYLDTLATSTPVALHCTVDFELQGCPVNKAQLLEVISAMLAGRHPAISASAVCLECKRRGQVCLMVARGTPCLGPVTHGGCNALCPSFDRGCFGCYGPSESPATQPLAQRLVQLGLPPRDIQRVFRTFTGASEAFRKESERHG